MAFSAFVAGSEAAILTRASAWESFVPASSATPDPNSRGWRRGVLALALLLALAAALYWWIVLIPRSELERMRAREAELIDQLRNLVSAQRRFYDQDLDDDGVYDYANAGELAAMRLFDARAIVQYQVELEVEAIRWQATAAPRDGRGHYFFVDHTGVVRAQTAVFAGSHSAPLAPDARQVPNR